MTNDNNPWLSGYDVPDVSSIPDPGTPGDGQAFGSGSYQPQPSAVGYGGGQGGGKGGHQQGGGSGFPPFPPWLKGLLYGVSIVAAGAASGLAASMSGSFYQSWQNPGPSYEMPAPTPVEEHLGDYLKELIEPSNSIQLQVKSDRKAAMAYLKERNRIGLIEPSDILNDDRNFFKFLSNPITPYFIIEPRAGYERDFKALVGKGLQDYKLYAFDFQSEDHLYMVAAECGLPTPSAVDWVRQWSTWRDSYEAYQTSKCRPGGMCVLLSRTGCSARAVSSFME